MEDPLNEARIEYLRAWRALAHARFEHIADLSNNIFRQLVLLNGGAIVALFTLLGHDTNLHPAPRQLFSAFAAFAIGLGSTLAAMTAAFFSQNHFFRMEHLSAELIGAEIMDVPAREGIKPPAARLGNIARNVAIGMSFVAATAFAAGCYLALVAVVQY